jgi:hypothetical protein
VHVLVPSHVDVQFEPQVPAHSDCPAHVLVQPVPHVRSQLFLESQWYVTLLGAAPGAEATEPSTPAFAGAPPRTQVPPLSHVHVLPEQLQLPEQAGVVSAESSCEPHATNVRSATIVKTPTICFIERLGVRRPGFF